MFLKERITAGRNLALLLASGLTIKSILPNQQEVRGLRTLSGGTKMLAVPVSPAFHELFRALAKDMGCSGEQLMREAMRDLFIKHKRGPFAPP